VNDFVPFPKTPYLKAPSGVHLREDKILTPNEADALLGHRLVVEEKIDGQNLGISAGESGVVVQSRGDYVELGGRHFQGLAAWLGPRSQRIAEGLGDGLVLFGEWCTDTHTTYYSALPDWFVVFDVFDRRKQDFWPSPHRDEFARQLGLSTVPSIAKGQFDISALESMFGPSKFGAARMEGIVLRAENEERLLARAKLLAPGFVQSIGEHWTRGRRRRNRIRTSG
jgi:ATP-dependent RNA circularization protein (DNA/RNA ligase family)